MDKCAGPLADARVDLEGRGLNNFYLVCSEVLSSLMLPLFLYAVGGYDGYNTLNTAERYDPDLDSWTPIASMSTARSALGLIAL